MRSVLFLCTGNSARSIMAEVLIDHWGQGRFKGFSAGSFPAGEVNPLTIELLSQSGLPTDGLRSKSWDEFAESDALTMDFVFTVCDQAGRCLPPVWPGDPITAHWGVPDPAAVEGDRDQRMVAFRQAFGMLEQRIRKFVELRDTLDRISLKTKLREIGSVGEAGG